jgi:hypothetical protein
VQSLNLCWCLTGSPSGKSADGGFSLDSPRIMACLWCRCLPLASNSGLGVDECTCAGVLAFSLFCFLMFLLGSSKNYLWLWSSIAEHASNERQRMVQLSLQSDQGWIKMRSTDTDLVMFRSNVCEDWKLASPKVYPDSVCELALRWLSKSVDRSSFVLEHYDMNPVDWRIEHYLEGEDGTTVDPNAFLSGTALTRAQLFDLICAFLEDGSGGFQSFAAKDSIATVPIKTFGLTSEVTVACHDIRCEVDPKDVAPGDVEIPFEWHIFRGQKLVWKSNDTDIVAALLDLIYQRGKGKRMKPHPFMPVTLDRWGDIEITEQMLLYFAETGTISRDPLNARKKRFGFCNNDHSLSHLRFTKNPLPHDAWDI